jgi:hypothetical protein
LGLELSENSLKRSGLPRIPKAGVANTGAHAIPISDSENSGCIGSLPKQDQPLHSRTNNSRVGRTRQMISQMILGRYLNSGIRGNVARAFHYPLQSQYVMLTINRIGYFFAN